MISKAWYDVEEVINKDMINCGMIDVMVYDGPNENVELIKLNEIDGIMKNDEDSDALQFIIWERERVLVLFLERLLAIFFASK